MHRLLMPVLAAVGLHVLLTPSVAQDGNQQGVNFQEEVAPLFARHCLVCHGEIDSRGGLQLHTREAAEFGGDTMLPILGGTLETNEIYRRVSSDDMTYRMPKGADALSENEIDTIRRWVEAGTPWVDRPQDISGELSSDKASPLMIRLGEFIDRADSLSKLHPYRFPWLMAALFTQIVILAIERVRKQPENDGGEQRWIAVWVTLVRKEHYVIVWMILLATLLLPISHARTKAAEALSETYSSEVARLRQKVDDLEGTPSSLLRYGDPPIPPRPDHPAALTHTYYRGNCERNEELFNNGNYQTAEFHVSLRDADGRLMSAGDSLPDDGLMVRFEMNRSPGTTPALFTEKVISAVYLSQSIYKNDKQPSEESPDVVHLSTIKADWKWSADYPLPSVDPNGELLGIIYVNKGRVTPERVTAIPHYGIRYSLKVEDGRLSDASEIWMGCIFQTPVIAERQTGKIPFSQWYDHNPLPVITGENTSDPELLGIPEHIEGSSVEAQEADQTTTDSDSGQ